MLGRLPDEVAWADVEALVPVQGIEARRRLVQVGLAYQEDERLRVLAPVREYVRDALAPGEEDLARAMEHYGALARALGRSRAVKAERRPLHGSSRRWRTWK